MHVCVDLHNGCMMAKPVGVLIQLNFEHFIKQIRMCDEIKGTMHFQCLNSRARATWVSHQHSNHSVPCFLTSPAQLAAVGV